MKKMKKNSDLILFCLGSFFVGVIITNIIWRNTTTPLWMFDPYIIEEIKYDPKHQGYADFYVDGYRYFSKSDAFSVGDTVYIRFVKGRRNY